MDTPLLSVIIPAHNVAPWLKRCVDSLLSQPGPSLEIIVVDDASSDGTSALCDTLEQQDPRVKALHCQFRDVSLTRNAGLEIARGDYVGFADGDDAVAPDLLNQIADIADRDRPDIIRYGYCMLYPDGHRKDLILPYPEGLVQGQALRAQQLDGICYEHVLDYSRPQVLSACSHFFRRDFLGDLRFVSQKEVLSEDYLFVLTALFRAETVYHLPQALYHYITRPGSLSRTPKPRMMERKKALMAHYLRFLPQHDEEVSCRLRNFYIDSVYDCFVNAALQAASPREALKCIRLLLQDEQLHRCIRENRDRIRSRKTRCICFLMTRRMALSMYLLYRLLTGRKEK